MEFRLTYEGPLPSSGNAPHGKEKHDIRRKFHPQLQKLWQDNDILRNLKHPPEFPEISSGAGTTMRFMTMDRMSRIAYLASQYQRNGFQFVPLVTADLFLWCSLDILYLRPGRPGMVIQGADIDGHLKTLFDALKMPRQAQDLGGQHQPSVGESPFYCLLEDDSLISQISVETDSLLEHIGGSTPHKDDARVVITVKLHPAVFKWENMGFV